MDRFIEAVAFAMMKGMVDLKSSMDRFIVPTGTRVLRPESNLKSSMDRFIVIYLIFIVNNTVI